MGIGIKELIIILVIVMLLFGTKKIKASARTSAAGSVTSARP